MNTAERLEAITNSGLFEQRATLVLCKANKDYQAIIEHGINAKGETVPSPNDGFCLIPNSGPPQFLWVQHTITKRGELRDKWLNESKGDLFKAWKRAQLLKQDFSNAIFTVILSTNQRIPTERSEARLLDEDVYIRAKKLGLNAEIWEQSKYARFLDGDRDGQWLRKEFFGTDAEMLSPGLLAHVSKKSLAVYEDIQVTDPDNWIARPLFDRIRARGGSNGITIKFLTGESGHGKSAAAYLFLKKHIEAGGYGLFIPESTIDNSLSLEEALRTAFSRFYPTLLSNEVNLLPNFIPEYSEFVIVVDDINQITDAPAQIRRLINWAKHPFLVVCPIWPRFRSAIHDLEKKPEVDVVSVELMSIPEAISAVEAVGRKAGLEFSKIEARSISAKLHCDPYLIGLLGGLLSGVSNQEVSDLVENTIEDFVTECIKTSAHDLSYRNPYLEREYREALFVLTSKMLSERNLYPTWNEVKDWLHNSAVHLDSIRQLCQIARLSRVSDEGQFKFQHDRVFNHFAVNCMQAYLGDIARNADVLFEPYYAEMLGQAIVKSRLNEATLNEISEKQPLALITTIRFMGTPSSEYDKLLVRKVKEWVSVKGSSSATPESIRGEVANSFINTDSPAVLEIVNTDFKLEVPWLGDWARFRNGDAKSAIDYCSRHSQDFLFGHLSRSKDSFWEHLVDHAKRHHRGRLVRDMIELLKSPGKNDLKGLLVLAGFLALPELQSALAERWNQMAVQRKYFAEMLWAAIRCSSDLQEDSLLQSLMDYWANPPEVTGEQRLEWQNSIAVRIGYALTLDSGQELVDFLTSQSDLHDELHSPLADICGLTDYPDAIEFALRECVGRMNEQERYSVISKWTSSSHLNPVGKLSDLSVARLQSIWQPDDNQDSLRQQAFQLWLFNVNQDHVDVLSLIEAILPSSPLFAQALWHRAWLHDRSCIEEFVALLEVDSSYFRVAWRVWSNEVMDVTEKYLRKFEANIPQNFTGGKEEEHYDVAGMLKMIPQEDAERLLQAYWGHLKYSQAFVLTAMFVGSSRCLELAANIIPLYPDNVNPFEHIDSSFFGFGNVTEHSQLNLDKLKNLLPYLSYFDGQLFGWYIDSCHHFGQTGIEWCQNNLPESVRESYQKRYFPTEDDLLQSLDSLPTDHNSALFWLEQFEVYQRHGAFPRKWKYPQNPLHILEKWLQFEPTYYKLKVAAACIGEIGSRQDLKILDVSLDNVWEKHHVDRIRDSVAFEVCRRTLQ
jgi:hypothetical protein